MNLILEVISPNGSGMGGGRRKSFGPEGGRIGRADDCDWVLPSPDKYVSRHHATVFFKYGQFYVKAEGDNGVAINSPGTLLAFDVPSPLKQGDKIFIDEYEILASVQADPVRAPLIVGDPFESDSIPDSQDPLSDSRDQENLDPLNRLPSAPVRNLPREQRYPGPPAGSVLNDPFAPPPRKSAPAAVPPISSVSTGGQAIPTDPDAWNKTTYGITGFPASQPVAAPPPKPLSPEPPPHVEALQPAPKPPDRARRPVAPPVAPSIAPRAAPMPAPSAPPERAAERPAPAPRTSEVRRAPASQATAPPAAPTAPAPTPNLRFDVDSMLRAAGVDPQNVSAETAATLGQILFIVVQGTIDALRARDEVKSQFRLAVTRVRDRDNNPLSFSVDAADAINSLLSRRSAGYLPPLEAFQRAFDDIRAHQIAMLAGMRAGFENLLARFDPEQLQEEFDKRAKRSGVLGVVKPKYWDLYSDYYAALRGDRDDAFRRLFGEEFALAYEKQSDFIKRNRGKKTQ
jgi:type VI secretion system FHA domain protein